MINIQKTRKNKGILMMQNNIRQESFDVILHFFRL